MTITRDDFIARFPEFDRAGVVMVERVMEEAINALDAEVFGAQIDTALYYYVAHKLALTPFGRNARLSSKEGQSTYGQHYHSIMLGVTSGYRVAL